MSTNPSLRNVLRTEPAAERLGLAVPTFRNLCCQGIAPPPAFKIGTVGFWNIGDLDFFKANYKGRPARRNSFKARHKKG